MIIDIQKFIDTPLIDKPYKHLIINNFIHTEFLDATIESFPYIPTRGSLPLSALQYNKKFALLIADLYSDELKRLTAEKFGLDLKNASKMLTLRGYTGSDDGKIHIDSKGKLITFLLYMNKEWPDENKGSLRILHNKNDIEHFAANIPPKAGTLVVFECTDHAWHGHTPFIGPRKSMQFNYVKTGTYLIYEQFRHKISAFFKNLYSI
jgi:SM-20-related protein